MNTPKQERSTATAEQLKRLLKALREGRKNTYELRKVGVSHPSGRVRNLLQRGCVIETERITALDSDGFSHAGVARYELIAESTD